MTLVMRRTRAVDKALGPLGATEQAVARIFQDSAGAFRDGWSLSRIQHELTNGSLSTLINSAPWDDLARTLSGTVGPLHDALLAGGRRLDLSGSFNGTFDYQDPRTLAYAQAQAGHLVTAVTDSTREAIARTVTDGIAAGATTSTIARDLREVCGVTDRGARQLSNAYDSAYSQAIAGGATEAAARAAAEQAQGALRDRLVGSRAETIARTETARAEMAGTYLGWAQGVEAGDIDPESRKQWIAGNCDICQAMDGETVMWDEPFLTVDVDMPPAHPNCTCTVVLLPAETPLTEAPADEVDGDTGAAEVEDEIGSPTDAQLPSYADMQQEERLRALHDDFDATLQPFRDAGLETKVKVTDVYGTRGRVKVAILDAEGNFVGELKRIFDFETGTVTHDIFMLDEAWQGRGLAAAQGALAEDLYRARGMGSIRLQANIDVGGYTWARMGYDWDLESAFFDPAEFVAHRLDYLEKLTEGLVSRSEELAQIRALRDAVAAGQLPTPLELARVGAGTSDIGRRALLGSNWYGVKVL